MKNFMKSLFAIIAMIAFTSANANPVVTLPTKAAPVLVKVEKAKIIQPVFTLRKFEHVGGGSLSPNNSLDLSGFTGGSVLAAVTTEDDGLSQAGIEDALAEAGISYSSWTSGEEYEIPSGEFEGMVFRIYTKTP